MIDQHVLIIWKLANELNCSVGVLHYVDIRYNDCTLDPSFTVVFVGLIVVRI